MSSRSVLSMILLGVIVLLLASCGAPTPTPAPATVVAEKAAAVEEAKSQFALTGTSWQLESMFEPEEAIPALPGVISSVGFELERYAGFGGCDWFVGVYSAQGDTLSMQTPATTRGGCVTEPKAASQQDMFMTSLRNVTNYAVEDGKLAMYTTGNQRLLTLVPLEAVPFEGTTWELIFYFPPDVPQWTPRLPGAVITAQFDGAKLSGNAGCNDYAAEYTREGDRLKLNALGVTLKTCAVPEGVMDQEKLYLELLQQATVIRQFPRSIELLRNDGMPQLAYYARPKATP